MNHQLTNINQVHKIFIWHGRNKDYTLKEMCDRHLVNSMRMLYNHFFIKLGLAKIPGGVVYSEISTIKNAKAALYNILIFMYEIETNRKLTDEYKILYEHMKYNILAAAGIKFYDPVKLHTIMINDKSERN